ncbi:MAG: DUF4442 domain-containing protein [Syntrophomonadaceae bacterium]|jgi:acyl-coenzyme A thioesterase PaaI-like protein|nr:DUF4442 domain-containing protein [Syntrophomonadaceae bacterium]
MDATDLPFNILIGLQYAADSSDYLFMLEDKNQYHNHVGTVHASAQFALAEATSGHYLKQQFSELPNLILLLKKVESRYRRPARGKLFSKAALYNVNKEEVIDSINKNGKALAHAEAFLFDKNAELVMQSLYEWYLMLEKE